MTNPIFCYYQPVTDDNGLPVYFDVCNQDGALLDRISDEYSAKQKSKIVNRSNSNVFAGSVRYDPIAGVLTTADEIRDLSLANVLFRGPWRPGIIGLDFRGADISAFRCGDPNCNKNRERNMVTLVGHPNVSCDHCLASVVLALNNAGLRTIASCCGHHRQPPTIALADGREIRILTYDQARQVDELFSGINEELP